MAEQSPKDWTMERQKGGAAEVQMRLDTLRRIRPHVIPFTEYLSTGKTPPGVRIDEEELQFLLRSKIIETKAGGPESLNMTTHLLFIEGRERGICIYLPDQASVLRIMVLPDGSFCEASIEKPEPTEESNEAHHGPKNLLGRARAWLYWALTQLSK